MEIINKIAKILTFWIPVQKWRKVLRFKLTRFGNKAINPFILNKALNLAKNSIYEISKEPEKDLAYIFIYAFFDAEGEHFFSGGAERYARDLSVIFEKKGWTTILFQRSTKYWIKKKDNTTVIGLPGGYYQYLSYLKRLPSPRFAVYSGMNEWGQDILKPSVLLSHGIEWDALTMNANIKGIKDLFKPFHTVVSVDTNTISWLRSTFSYDLNKHPKDFRFIPNYVDLALYTPIRQERKRIKITYPRRLSFERGYWVFAPIAEKLIEKYPDVDIEFIGFIQQDKIKENLEILMNKHGSRIIHKCVDAALMHKVYQNTDISVIPTLHSEGTSLSCLEAMACGNTVIATNIGGLTNLIINDYNGILINPLSEELYDALCKVIENEDLRAELPTNALHVCQKFSKTIWTERWEKLIEDICGKV